MTEITAKSIVERILFGKGGSKADYAKDIEALIEFKCKEAVDNYKSELENADDFRLPEEAYFKKQKFDF